MNSKEVSQKYNIPMEILENYENSCICQAVEKCNYNNTDMERICLIVTLNDIGFSEEQIDQYMLWEEECSQDSCKKQSEMLLQFREKLLENVHTKEKQLECLDALKTWMCNRHKH